jgi:glycosyltransferase involved in cell wall biosynthesis
VAVTGGPELTVVVPAFNEADTIALVVERLQALPYELQIIVVDDCSDDGTAAVVEGLGDAVELIRH